jgi:3'(2'), 5'-bisphosphate nucleotidase
MKDVFEKAALDAGRIIMDICRAGAEVTFKDDRSPVTLADQQAETIILAALAESFPSIPVVAEESVAAGTVPDISGGTFFLVDPLDGTKEFVSGRDEFTVNIALIVDTVPVAGIVYAPARGIGYIAENGKAERFTVDGDYAIAGREPIGCRHRGADVMAVASRSHGSPETERFLSDNAIGNCASIGSSLKFCLVAEGVADVYPRFSRTMEWDTAAGDAILRAAGGTTRRLDGTPLPYGKIDQAADSDFANPHFISWGAGHGPAAG